MTHPRPGIKPIVPPNPRWYLGLEGVYLAGQGLGIETVNPGSPAELAGLSSGMILLQVNGIQMATEDAMKQAMATSGGVLNVVILTKDGQQHEGTLQMARLASSIF